MKDILYLVYREQKLISLFQEHDPATIRQYNLQIFDCDCFIFKHRIILQQI